VKSARIIVTGRVQGVGYRMWAERTASALGIRGWVRNRADRSVELLAIGDDGAVDALIEACGQGPRHAEVSGVSVSNASDDGSIGFSTTI